MNDESRAGDEIHDKWWLSFRNFQSFIDILSSLISLFLSLVYYTLCSESVASLGLAPDISRLYSVSLKPELKVELPLDWIMELHDPLLSFKPEINVIAPRFGLAPEPPQDFPRFGLVHDDFR